ncbi:PAS domain-containing hybrid sensor histidine kinase/response regulator [Vibrio hangzhouensis]|uniref:histidine kinase n=1 Tax=Vibrio hangzhouensis TaxID=462991 RepID=A0A1H5V4I5_9VIBR|nr:PAS domain-containing hybrid sensor histidine kinase/response regulator [Vibrio hangzhouensis]SEF82134.1 PAS domain S-box-containing protein [Vibrio hangzhouensis]
MKFLRAAQYTGQTLLTIFMMLTFGITAIAILLMTNYEAEKTIDALQKDSSQIEIQAAKNFMDQFFIAMDMHISHLVEEPAIIAAVKGNFPKKSPSNHDHNHDSSNVSSSSNVDEDNIFKHLHQFHLSNAKVKFCLFDANGIVKFNSLPQEGPIENRLALLSKIKQTQSQLTVYLLRQQNQQKVIRFYKPIYSNETLSGVVVGAFPYNNTTFFSSLQENNTRWYSLTQPGSTWVETPPGTDWNITSVKLDKSDISLQFGVNRQTFINQKNALLYSLAFAILIALTVSSAIVYLLGQQLIINPFQKLEQSKIALSVQTKLLNKKVDEARLLTNVVKQANDAILIANHNGHVEWVNHAFEKLSGWTLEEIKGVELSSLLYCDHSDPLATVKITDSLTRGIQTRVELINHSRDHVPYWVDIDITPTFDTKGATDKFIVIERDITTHKKLLEKLELAVKAADSANIAKSQFLATMSHEIRTPMNGVLGMVQVMLSETEDPKQKESLMLILDSGNHLISILNDILDLTKVEQNRIEIEENPFNLEQIVAPLLSTYQTVCKEKGIHFTIQCNVDNKVSYLGDKNRIRQILYNLINNAIKFTKLGAITVTIGRLKPHSKHISFVVEDTGIGIQPDALDIVFEPFVQADTSTTRDYGGTGLGLAIVKQLIEKMGGTIQASSIVGQGTRFEFEIPLRTTIQPADSLLTQHYKDSSNLSGLDILVVEDNHINALIAQKLLEKDGQKVTIVENGQLALDALSNHPYDLVLLDNHMPVMDGIEACRQIRQQFDSGILIFGWTADVFSDSKQSFIDAGADCVLHKPLKKEALFEALNRFKISIGKQHAGR